MQTGKFGKMIVLLILLVMPVVLLSEAPILGPHNVKSELIGKDPDAGKD